MLIRTAGLAATTVLLGGLVLAGCGEQTGEGGAPASSSPASAVSTSPETDDSAFTTADCLTRQSGSATVDRIPPTSRREAAAWPQTPYEAARNTQTAPASEAALGSGELIEVENAPNEAFYTVVEGGRVIGMLTVRPVGFGAFATDEIKACTPTR